METRKEMNDWAVSLWNRTVPADTEVILTEDWGDECRTKTRSRAYQHEDPDATPMVQVEGRTGGYLLWRIRPVTHE